MELEGMIEECVSQEQMLTQRIQSLQTEQQQAMQTLLHVRGKLEGLEAARQLNERKQEAQAEAPAEESLNGYSDRDAESVHVPFDTERLRRIPRVPGVISPLDPVEG
jgi:hypothetical protein